MMQLNSFDERFGSRKVDVHNGLIGKVLLLKCIVIVYYMFDNYFVNL